MNQVNAFLMVLLILVITGCASSRPVFYPNDQQAANHAIETCKARAEQAGISNVRYKTEQAVVNTTQGAAVGAVSGLVGGAFSGGLGIGAAIGAASGATIGLISSLFSVEEPNPTYQNFINRCLQERGYDVLGWE